MDASILLLLIAINGLFAMSEIAIVSSRSARLQRLVDDGRPGAAAALALHRDPSNFLSTIQVGITSVGVLSGTIGESVLADPLTATLSLSGIPWLAAYARPIAVALTVALITYFSVVVGELVPKRLALLGPERIGTLVAPPMSWLARAAAPLVWLLSASSNLLLRLTGAVRSNEPPVTDDEILVLMGQGAEAGVFHEDEQELVSNVLRLDDLPVAALMTPRTDVVAIDLESTDAELRAAIAAASYSRVVVCRDGLDHVVGVLHRSDLLDEALAGKPLNIEGAMAAPVYVPENITTMRLLEMLREVHAKFTIVINEYGEMKGIITLDDVLFGIMGHVMSRGVESDAPVKWLNDDMVTFDAGLAISRFAQELDLPPGVLDPERSGYHTVGGLVMQVLGRVPAVGDRFRLGDWEVEVLAMEDRRVGRVSAARGVTSRE